MAICPTACGTNARHLDSIFRSVCPTRVLMMRSAAVELCGSLLRNSKVSRSVSLDFYWAFFNRLSPFSSPAYTARTLIAIRLPEV